MYITNALRSVFSYCLYLGGPYAYWVSYVVGMPFIIITALMLAEVCSSLPAAGSIYFWAAHSGGPRFGRLFGFVVAWWSTTAWTSFLSMNCSLAANYILSEISVFGLGFTTSVDDVKFRAVQWIVAEGILLLSVLLNYIPPRWYKYAFKLAAIVQLIDFLLNVIWLPVGVSKTYGFQDAAFLKDFENGSGLPNAWTWMLGFYCGIGGIVGYDASGHVAEETKNASLLAARGLLWSAVVSVVLGLPIAFIFLMCCPSLDVVFSFTAPQGFIPIYALALGKGGHVVMTVVATVGSILGTSVSAVAASRLVFAVARDGVLPFSDWIRRVAPNGQPKNALTVVSTVAAILLCSILPSTVAFNSLVSCAGLPTVCAYALIPFGRLFLSREKWPTPKFSLGVFSKPLMFIAMVWNLYYIALLITPLEYPVTAQNFNYAPVVLAIITIFGIASWWLIPEERWAPYHRTMAKDN